jgi:hypothetical protein
MTPSPSTYTKRLTCLTGQPARFAAQRRRGGSDVEVAVSGWLRVTHQGMWGLGPTTPSEL